VALGPIAYDDWLRHEPPSKDQLVAGIDATTRWMAHPDGP
jgi:hypothetical protein